jgi:rhodanese-related sulfurtransferase
MKLMSSCSHILLSVYIAAAWNAAVADPPIPITADDAFDAVQMQIDPVTEAAANVILVDVRDPLEIFSSGAAGAVSEIVLADGTVIKPDLGKVWLVRDDNMEQVLDYDVEGDPQTTAVANVQEVLVDPIAINVPFWRRTESDWKKTAKNFYPVISKLAREFNVIILYCRTGGRSSLAGDGIEPGLFDAVYEIDDPSGQNGRGGFTGPSDANKYNGYAGFPTRLTTPVSWVDHGLPVIRASKATP